MGRVFLGRSPGGRLLAVKVIRENLAEDLGFRARFAREVAAARSVSGLFTAPVVDADLDARLPWLATAYVPGPSLADAVNRYGVLPPASVLALMAGLAEGLIAIHAAGLVHRDLKPANVLLAEDGPRVIDFGISLAAETASLTHTGVVIGSPSFMSPEQAEGGPVGSSSDVFSLGSVLAFAATGEAPFGQGSTAALVYRVVHAQPSLDQVPGEIRPLLVRCLAKDPAGRPGLIELLAEAGEQLGGAGLVEGWLPGQIMADYRQRTLAATQAPPDPPVVPRRAPLRDGGAGRQRRAVLGLGVAALVVAAAAGVIAMATTSDPAPIKGRQLAEAAGVPRARSHPAVTASASKASTAATPSYRAAAEPQPSKQPPAAQAPTVTESMAAVQPSQAPPATPVHVEVVPSGSYKMTVSWADASAAGTGFHVDNGCPPGACGGGLSLAQTTRYATSAVFAVTPGTYQCFRVQAFNTHGASGWSAYGCGSTPGLVVPGTQQWTDTGVEVRAGDKVGLTASGVVNIAGDYGTFAAGPGGNHACTPARDHPADTFPAPSQPCWSLIARIGNGPPFEVGPATLVVPGSGELYLGINDDSVSGNSGSWTVNIKIGALPPPP